MTAPNDAIQRTLLANERTYLAWWRTGITALTVALAAARVVPELADVGQRWPYTLLGVGYALCGIGCIVFGGLRRVRVARAVRDGDWSPLPGAAAHVLTGAGAILGVATILVFLLDT